MASFKIISAAIIIILIIIAVTTTIIVMVNRGSTKQSIDTLEGNNEVLNHNEMFAIEGSLPDVDVDLGNLPSLDDMTDSHSCVPWIIMAVRAVTLLYSSYTYCCHLAWKK